MIKRVYYLLLNKIIHLKYNHFWFYVLMSVHLFLCLFQYVGSLFLLIFLFWLAFPIHFEPWSYSFLKSSQACQVGNSNNLHCNFLFLCWVLFKLKMNIPILSAVYIFAILRVNFLSLFYIWQSNMSEILQWILSKEQLLMYHLRLHIIVFKFIFAKSHCCYCFDHFNNDCFGFMSYSFLVNLFDSLNSPFNILCLCIFK